MRSTPLAIAVVSASSKKDCASQLFDEVYMMAREETSFNKYPLTLELENGLQFALDRRTEQNTRVKNS